RGRGDVQMFRVEVPGPEISKAATTEDARVTVAIPRAEFNHLATQGRVRDYIEAVENGHIRASGDSNIQKLIAQVVQRHEERVRSSRGAWAVDDRGVDPAKLARMRATTQLLHRPISAKDPAAIARGIAGAQAQDVYAGPLTFRSRSRTLTAADIAWARTQERSLLRTWVMRMTIHMIPAEDAGWWLPLFEPWIEKWSRRRLSQLGLPKAKQDKALRVAAHALASEGPLTRNEVRARIESAGVKLNSHTGMH